MLRSYRRRLHASIFQVLVPCAMPGVPVGSHQRYVEISQRLDGCQVSAPTLFVLGVKGPPTAHSLGYRYDASSSST